MLLFFCCFALGLGSANYLRGNLSLLDAFNNKIINRSSDFSTQSSRGMFFKQKINNLARYTL